MAEGSDILQRLDIADATLTETPNGGSYWIALTRYHEGHRYSHSVRIPVDPSPEDIDNAREVFQIWWSETIKEQLA